MKKILIVDNDLMFVSDLQANLIIHDVADYEVLVVENDEKARSVLNSKDGRVVLAAISSRMLGEVSFLKEVKCVQFSHTKTEEGKYANDSMFSLGIFSSSDDLIEAVVSEADYPEATTFSGKEYTDVAGDVADDEVESVKPADSKPAKKAKGTSVDEDDDGSHRDMMDGRSNAMRRQSRETSKKRSEIGKALNKELKYGAKEKARCIVVYSAKGGVGKTTIACELATMLSLTENGRSHYNVCVADFNVDFGDVLNQLDCDSSGPCMTHWIADIRIRLSEGDEPEDINYSAEQIARYLQKKTDTNLKVLLAPITNQDSMDIKPEEIEVMVRNLVDNGGFDFVIIDTGNNTRDTTYIPMKYAEQVLVIITQSLNTANCNNGFFTTMSKIHFDMTKFKLVVNRIMPSKSTGIDVEQLKAVFRNMKDWDGRIMYSITECYAEIKETTDAISAGNDGVPLVVKDPSHEFSKGIGNIMSSLIHKEYELPEQQKKKGFFAKLFGKKE